MATSHGALPHTWPTPKARTSSFGHIVAPFWAIATCLATPGIIENYYSVSSLYVKIRIGTLELLIDTVVGRNPSHNARKGNGRPESAARASILPEPCSFYYHNPPTTVLAAACQAMNSASQPASAESAGAPPAAKDREEAAAKAKEGAAAQGK